MNFINIWSITDRPKCGYCKFGFADGMGKRKDGNLVWRIREGKYECKPCQRKHININSEKGYPTMSYQHYKKSFIYLNFNNYFRLWNLQTCRY